MMALLRMDNIIKKVTHALVIDILVATTFRYIKTAMIRSNENTNKMLLYFKLILYKLHDLPSLV